MDLIDIALAVKRLEQNHVVLSETETEFVLWFAFSTGDRELTGKLVDELSEPDADKDAICQKFETLTGVSPDWIKMMEHLLVILEMYRIQEEKAMKRLADFLKTAGASINAEEFRQTDMETVQEKTAKEASL